MQVYSYGAVRFETYLVNNDAASTHQYAVACAFRDRPSGQPANVYFTSRSGVLDLRGTANSVSNVNVVLINRDVEANWFDIWKSETNLYCKESSRIEESVLLGELLEEMIQHGTVIGTVGL